MTARGFICSPRTYRFQGWEFEYGHCGPGPLRSNGELYQRIPPGFWRAFEKWLALPKRKREQYRTGGGCEAF